MEGFTLADLEAAPSSAKLSDSNVRGVAQLGLERFVRVEEVASSNLVTPIVISPCKRRGLCV